MGGQEVAAVGRGDVVGEMAVLDGGPRSATVTALTPIAAYVCTPAELAALCAAAPSVDRIIRHRAAARARANRARRRPAGRTDRADAPRTAPIGPTSPTTTDRRPGTAVAWPCGGRSSCRVGGPRSRATCPVRLPTSPTVVMLHGLGATGALNWSHGLEVLNERFRVVALDHRGHGRGIDAGEPFTLEDCADDAVALADVLGVDRAIYVGYSMGGPIAQLVWHRHAERVRGPRAVRDLGRVLLARRAVGRRPRPRGGAPDHAAHPPAARRRGHTGRRWPASSSAPSSGRTCWTRCAGTITLAVRDAAQAVLSFSSTDWIGDVSVPTAVVVTERDHLVPTARQRDLAARIPGASVVALDGNHMVFLTEPEALAAAVLEACRAVSAAAPTVRRRWTARPVVEAADGRRYQVRRCSGMASPAATSGVRSQRAVQARRANRQPAGVRTTTSW